MQNVKIRMDLFGDKNGPSIIMEYDVYKNNYIDVIRRGGKIRLITEITKENVHYCKELMKIVTELTHMDGLVGGIAVSESEYMLFESSCIILCKLTKSYWFISCDLLNYRGYT